MCDDDCVLMTDEQFHAFMRHPLLGRVKRIRPLHGKLAQMPTSAVHKKRGKSTRRCGTCDTCILVRDNVGLQCCSNDDMCINCADKPSNGGKGLRKRSCVLLDCERPIGRGKDGNRVI